MLVLALRKRAVFLWRGYWAEVPALPGCITEGESMDEVINNLQDAIQGWLEVANESKKPDPISKIISYFLKFLQAPYRLAQKSLLAQVEDSLNQELCM